VARYTTHYIANSDAAAVETVRVEGVDRRRISVLPNCLDPDAFAAFDPELAAQRKREWGFAPDTLVVGAVANLRPVKNLLFLVRAAARVMARLPQVGFVVLGEGPQRGELEALVRSLNLGSRFLLPGVSTTVARDIQAFDVCALCSFGESSSNSIVEAMAAGKPSVVSQVGGNAELIQHGQTGYLYPSDDMDRFVDLLVDLLLDPGKRRQMGTRAAAAARSRFDARVVIPRLEHLYETLLGERAALPV
jgi:glycosyltransferase involved in cell wall biosynthesis